MSFSISERDSICSIPRRPSSVASPPPEAPKPSLFRKRRGSLHSGSPPRPTPGLVVPSAWPSSPAHGTSVLLGGLRWFNRPPRERREDVLLGRPPCSLSRCVCTDFPRCRLIGGGLTLTSVSGLLHSPISCWRRHIGLYVLGLPGGTCTFPSIQDPLCFPTFPRTCARCWHLLTVPPSLLLSALFAGNSESDPFL